MAHRQFTYDAVPVWAYGTTAIYHPLSPVLETAEVETVRLALEMSQTTPGVTMTPAYDLSDDGCDWDTPVEILYQAPVVTCSADGVQYDTDFVDIATVTNGTNSKRYMRFGVLVVHSTASTLGLCRASLQIDVRC